MEPRKIRVQDVASETLQDLAFARDRVVEVGLGRTFDFVCFVYRFCVVFLCFCGCLICLNYFFILVRIVCISYEQKSCALTHQQTVTLFSYLPLNLTGFEWLVVTTTTQCYIYSLSNLNTPTIFDIKAPPHFLHLCKKCFLTLDQISGLQIISYEGRVICSPRFQGERCTVVMTM